MKKTIYLSLLVLLVISFGCETDEILVNEQNDTIDLKAVSKTNGDLNIKNDIIGKDHNLNQTKSTPNIPLNTSQNSTVDEFTEDGIINYSCFGNPLDPLPLNAWSVAITWVPGLTENQKMNIRCEYASYGQLIKFKSCGIEDKELWYLISSGGNSPCSTDPNVNCTETGEAPLDLPPGAVEIAVVSESCLD